MDDPAEAVGDEAAVALARWRDPAGVPRLVQMLEKGRDPRRARAALESVSLEVFGQDDPAMLASLYAGWWETTRERGPRGWLVDALALQGIDDPSLRAWESGGSSVAAVPAMLKALDDGTWAVRRAIDLVFREAASRSFGEIDRGTPHAESDRIVAQWKSYWTRRFGQ
ncbi:MAG: hypothetical protein HMLKMBBP_02744 [Planctomycetes bacterium]|nr:hypothetical protein [Planctomycetota bacterium]